MNLPTGLQATATSPVAIALGVLIGASLLVLFFGPPFIKAIGETKLPKEASLIKTHPLRSLAVLIAFFIAIFGAYLFYYFSQPVRIVSAGQFKLEKGKALQELQKEGFGSWQTARIYLLDIRTSKEYTADHLKGSASSPAAIAAIEIYPMERAAIAVFSSKSGFKEARQVADAIKKNGRLVKNRSSQGFGAIYVIKDGFEGLKAAGLATEAGIWD